MIQQEFERWLEETLGFTPRAARDVRSRVKRASKLVDILADIPDEELIFMLTKHPEFKELTMNVKSQLKRAVTLYREYIDKSKTYYNNI